MPVRDIGEGRERLRGVVVGAVDNGGFAAIVRPLGWGLLRGSMGFFY